MGFSSMGLSGYSVRSADSNDSWRRAASVEGFARRVCLGRRMSDTAVWTSPNPLQLPLFGKDFEPEADVGHKRRKPWAWLLKHVFAIDVNVCPNCGGRMK